MTDQPTQRKFPRPIAKDRTEPLYKFRAFSRERDLDPEWQGYAASLLRDGIVYAPAIGELNDPWEGRPRFRIPDESKDPAHARRFVEELLEVQEDVDRSGCRKWIEEQGFAAVVRSMQHGQWKIFSSRTVYSLAGSALPPLLWSHYADGHRGYCWIFDQQIMPLGGAIKVTYQEEFPEIDWADWKIADLVGPSLLTKGPYWNHEDEYRLLLPAGSTHPLLPICEHTGRGTAPRGQYLKLRPESLKGVILGANMDPRDALDLLVLAERFDRKLELHVSSIHTRKFEVGIRNTTMEELRLAAAAAAPH
jgi:hypothetical protein